MVHVHISMHSNKKPEGSAGAISMFPVGTFRVTVSPHQVHVKHAEQYLIQTDLFQFHLNKPCAANIQQAYFHIVGKASHAAL